MSQSSSIIPKNEAEYRVIKLDNKYFLIFISTGQVYRKNTETNETILYDKYPQNISLSNFNIFAYSSDKKDCKYILSYGGAFETRNQHFLLYDPNRKVWKRIGGKMDHDYDENDNVYISGGAQAVLLGDEYVLIMSYYNNLVVYDKTNQRCIKKYQRVIIPDDSEGRDKEDECNIFAGIYFYRFGLISLNQDSSRNRFLVFDYNKMIQFTVDKQFKVTKLHESINNTQYMSPLAGTTFIGSHIVALCDNGNIFSLNIKTIPKQKKSTIQWEKSNIKCERDLKRQIIVQDEKLYIFNMEKKYQEEKIRITRINPNIKIPQEFQVLLEDWGLKEYIPKFEEENFTSSEFWKDVKIDDLIKYIGMKLGDAVKFTSCCKKL